jgi:hypothetical protein
MKHKYLFKSRLAGLILGLLTMAQFGASPALATTYRFTVPVSMFQSALGDAIGGTANEYVIYDVYMRLSQVGDDSRNPEFPKPVWNVGAQAPAVTPYAWTDVVNGKFTDQDGIKGPADTGPYQSIHFTYGSTPNIAVIVYNNATEGGIVGKTVNNKVVGELVPDSSAFSFDVGSANSGLAGQDFKVFFFAYADRFSGGDFSADTPNKGSTLSGTFAVTAMLTPETSSMSMGGIGIVLIALGARRKRTSK